VISVLFVDIVGFTSRSEQLDPEDVRSFLNPYYERVRAEIEHHGGRIEKFVGDAVLGIFGAPVAHGDDAERAVRTALAIRDTLREMNEADRELDLQVRLAVNTGEAIVDLDARPEQTMIVGDVVNTASRLQTAAPVNGVLVGRETQAATRSSIAYASAPPVVAKGKAAPIEVWLALSAAAPVGARALSEAAFVGRQRELDLLARLWEQVCDERRPHLVTLIGPAGIGKSRLAEEFAPFVASRGGRPLRGRSVPYGESSAYGAFAQHVKQVAGIFDSDEVGVALEKLALAVPEGSVELTESLALLLGFQTEREVDREGLFFAARQFVENLARDKPTMLVFEDIHWADSSLLDLIEVLSARTQDVPLLFVTLARPELFASRQGWGGGLVSATALSLEPLPDRECKQLAAQLLAGRVGDEYAERLASSAEGNPLFIEELAAVVAERSAEHVDALPTTIRSILAARLDALEPDERSVLLDAAVVGKIFWRGVLERLQSQSVGLSTLLGALEERGLIRREAVSRIQGDEQYTFKHDLLRQVAYATVPRARRRERHAAVARFLEETTTETGESAATLAFHWREAGDTERALHHFLAAADHAGRGWAKERAIALYNDASRLLPEDDARRRDINRKRAVAFQAFYHVPDAASLAGREDSA
jgi:class 3 adenylate cyclase